MKLSIIVPAYNESDRIVPTLAATVAYLRDQAYDSEVVVVSDGSTDDTRRVVETRFPGNGPVAVTVLEYHPNRGKGYAVRHGMHRGKGELLLFMDADYSVPIQAVEKGVRLIQAGADVAIGSRAIRGSRITRGQSLLRSLAGKVYTAMQNQYLGISYPDTQCGFKLFSRAAARRLFGRQRLHSVIFDPEILWLARREGYRVAQFPVTWQHHEDSRIVYDSIGKSLFIFRELFRIKHLHKRQSVR